MKKAYLFGRFLLLPFTFLLFTVFVFGGNIKVTDKSDNNLSLKESSYSSITISNQVSDIRFASVKTKEGIFTLLNVEDYGYRLVEGEPKLPVIKKLIEVPLDATYEINFSTKTSQEINLYNHGISDFIIPTQPSLSKSIDNPEDVDFIYNKSAYEVNGFVGPELVKVVDLGVMRGVRLARVEIAPVLYNPVQNKIKVFTDVEVQIEFKDGNEDASVQKR